MPSSSESALESKISIVILVMSDSFPLLSMALILRSKVFGSTDTDLRNSGVF